MTTSARPDILDLLEPVTRMAKDVQKAAATLGPAEARFLVSTYYEMQEQRKRAVSQVKALSESGEPHQVLEWYEKQWKTLEYNIKLAMDKYSDAHPLGRWGKSLHMVGPVISAGLLAHVDCTKPYAGNIWSFAGLTPGRVWKKGEKRPWNPELKRLCYCLGECIVRGQNHEADIYGKWYARRRKYEQQRDDAGLNKEAAATELRTKTYRKTTDAYKCLITGHLSPAALHARARRWVVKLVLSHWHTVGHYLATGNVPPRPYAFDKLGEDVHTRLVLPPNAESVEGLLELLERKWYP